jgi:hypothetical protein
MSKIARLPKGSTTESMIAAARAQGAKRGKAWLATPGSSLPIGLVRAGKAAAGMESDIDALLPVDVSGATYKAIEADLHAAWIAGAREAVGQ